MKRSLLTLRLETINHVPSICTIYTWYSGTHRQIYGYLNFHNVGILFLLSHSLWSHYSSFTLCFWSQVQLCCVGKKTSRASLKPRALFPSHLRNIRAWNIFRDVCKFFKNLNQDKSSKNFNHHLWVAKTLPGLLFDRGQFSIWGQQLFIFKDAQIKILEVVLSRKF